MAKANQKPSGSVTHLNINPNNPANGLKHREQLPEILFQVAYLRLWQIVNCHKEGVHPLLPISRTAWLEGIKAGKYPQPLKIANTNCWRSDEIAALILELDGSK